MCLSARVLFVGISVCVWHRASLYHFQSSSNDSKELTGPHILILLMTYDESIASSALGMLLHVGQLHKADVFLKGL